MASLDCSSLSLNINVEQPDRSSSLTPDSIIPSKGVIVVVDPISTGAHLAYRLGQLGHNIVRVWSATCPDKVKAHTQKGLEVKYVTTVQMTDDVSAAVAALSKHGPIREVMVGCETGVLAADQLSHALGVNSNGIERSALRRNKYLQVEAVRNAGLDAPRQTLATSAAHVEEWLNAEGFPQPFKAVVKPVEGAGSEGVAICDTPDEARAAYASLEGATNILGGVTREVLLQEYLQGDEYVVDTVTSNGAHKVVAVWKYDKRHANNSPVVYFGMRLLQLDAEPRLAQMVAYVEGCLDAIGIRWGAMHTEVKLEARGPVLVEVNCRLHGGEGIWLPISQACLGYTQVSAMCDAYLERNAFGALPAAPTQLKAHGAWVTIRSGATGTITSLDAARLSQLRALPSFLDEYVPLSVGDHVVTTVDACSVHGCINLAHRDPEQLAADYEAAQALVDAGLFEVAVDVL